MNTTYVLTAHCHDSTKVLRAYSSRSRAFAMARLGDQIEVGRVTRDYIDYARQAQSEAEREHWAWAMMQVQADGLRWWKHKVTEVPAS